MVALGARSLAILSGLGLVVLSLNRSRCTHPFMRQPIISRLSRDATADCAAGVSGGTAAEIKNTEPKKIETANSAEKVNQ
jgi:hypothetical protein